jgi:hypothetical protein
MALSLSFKIDSDGPIFWPLLFENVAHCRVPSEGVDRVIVKRRRQRSNACLCKIWKWRWSSFSCALHVGDLKDALNPEPEMIEQLKRRNKTCVFSHIHPDRLWLPFFHRNTMFCGGDNA